MIGINEFLSKKRISEGKSQGELAKFLGYNSPQFVSNWERNTAFPPSHQLRLISKYLNIDFVILKKIYIANKVEEMKRTIK